MLTLLLALLPGGVVGTFGVARAETAVGATFTDGLLSYRVLTNNPYTVEVAGWAGAAQAVLDIPATASDGTDSYSVTAVGMSAFDTDLVITSVSIPESVTEIKLMAFAEAENLTTLQLSENGNLMIIEGAAFAHTSVTSLSIPESVTEIGRMAFLYSRIETLVFPESGNLRLIGANAFEGCDIAGTLIIPASVTNIGTNAFSYNNITSITFPQGSRMQNLALQIIEQAYRANDVFISGPDRETAKHRRLDLQHDAITSAKLLGYMALLAREQGCILPKQYEQITKLVHDCQNLLGAWINSDRKRLS